MTCDGEPVAGNRVRSRGATGRRCGSRSTSCIFLGFIYLPMVLMGVLSFQGTYGAITFPFKGPVSLRWWQSLFDASVPGSHATEIRDSALQSLWLSLAAGAVVAILAFTLSMAFRRRFRGDGIAFYVIMLALMTPGFLLGLGTQLLWRFMDTPTSLWKTALGTNVIWGIPFGFLVMLAVWNRYDHHIEEASRDLGANQLRTFREVTLPLVWTGIFGCFLFGFTLTWNDYDRTLLLISGSETQTLPLQIAGLTFTAAIRPDLYALGTATTLFTIILILARPRWSRRCASGCGATGSRAARRSSGSWRSSTSRPPRSSQAPAVRRPPPGDQRDQVARRLGVIRRTTALSSLPTVLPVLALTSLVIVAVARAAVSDTRVSDLPGPQNEPAIAIDPGDPDSPARGVEQLRRRRHPDVLVGRRRRDVDDGDALSEAAEPCGELCCRPGPRDRARGPPDALLHPHDPVLGRLLRPGRRRPPTRALHVVPVRARRGLGAARAGRAARAGTRRRQAHDHGRPVADEPASRPHLRQPGRASSVTRASSSSSPPRTTAVAAGRSPCR